jgi:Protein of unknown function (DUF998)
VTAPLAWLAIAGFTAAALALITLHVLPSDADPLAEGVSAYGRGPTARIYQFQVVLSGIGGLALGAALATRGASALAIVALVAYGLARIAIAAYPTDLRGTPMTATGRIHAILATMAFLAMAIAAPASGGSPPLLILAAMVTITSLGSFAVAARPATVRFYGLAQRAFYVATFAWAIVASVVLPTV